jgi:hypothetical protein
MKRYLAGAFAALISLSAIAQTTVPTQLLSAGGTPAVGALGNIAGTANAAILADGSVANPHTANTPSFAITRTEAQNSATLSGNSPALWVETVSRNGGAGNPNGNAIEAISTQYGKGDTVGVVGWAIEAGSPGHYAYGAFFNGQADTAGSNAYAIETVTTNNTGSDAPLNTSAVPNMVGLHIDPMGSHNATSAIWISKDTNVTAAQWDAGIYLSSLAAVSYSFIDQTNSATSLFIGGTHQYGLNLINGTYTGNAIQANGFNVSNSGVTFASSLSLGSALPVASGGTGATTAAGALTALGAASTSSPTITTPNLVGVTNGSAATAGSVGEVQSGNSTGVSMTNNTAANCASKLLTAGEYLVWANLSFAPAATTTVSAIYAGTNTTSATLPANSSLTALTATFATGAGQLIHTTPTVVNVAAATTVYAVGMATFGASTMTCSGYINALRVR